MYTANVVVPFNLRHSIDINRRLEMNIRYFHRIVFIAINNEKNRN